MNKPGERSLMSRLSKRATILRSVEASGEYGGPVETWEPVCDVWAAVEPLRGQEYFTAGREGANVTTRIRIRYREAINRTMIVRCDGIDFEILSIIDPEFRHREMQLMCKERQ